MDLPVDMLFRRSPVEAVRLDRAFRILAATPGAARLSGQPSAVVPGADAREAFPELVGAEEDLRRVFSGALSTFRIPSIARDHTPDLYVTLAAEPDRSGTDIQELVLTLEDVSGWMVELQRRAQTTNDTLLLMQAITASKEYVDNIFEAMAELLLVTTADGTVNAVNRATLALTGYTSAEVIGRSIDFLFPGERPAEGPDLLNPRLPQELLCTGRNGITVPVSLSRAPLVMGGTVVHGIVYLGRDLREQHQARERISSLESRNLSLQEVLTAGQQMSEIIAASPAMRALTSDLSRVAVVDTTVLISGETGTGKELVARAIHRLSQRRDALMVTVNCAALPSGLIESELFGHEKGAFTGALQRRIGRFELANGGTVFLDEVGELPLPAQATLLRVLQEQEFERVGGTQSIKVDVRVIAATNRDLRVEVQKGLFRDDLLFRLNVFPLIIPPLRERKEDIPLLVRHFISHFARRSNKQVSSISREAERLLTRYAWPGNVRELANVIERAMIVARGNTLTEEDFALPDLLPEEPTKAETFDDMARAHLLRALEESHGVIEGPNGAAARLGLKPATLRSRLKRLGISRTSGRFAAGV